MNFININGNVIEVPAPGIIGYDNAAFRYGYGLFETMLVHNGSIRLWSYHRARLYAGIEQVRLTLPPAEQVEQELLALVEKNGASALCRTRLQVFGGEGVYGLDGNAGYIIECFPVTDARIDTDGGIVAGVATGLKKGIDSLSNLKTSSALLYAIALQEAKENNWQDTLICNAYGNIAESAIANIFWLKDNEVFTTPLSEGCVAGVMRQYVIDTLKTVREQPLTFTALTEADEVFLTNAIRIRSVKQVGSRVYQAEATRALLAGLQL